MKLSRESVDLALVVTAGILAVVALSVFGDLHPIRRAVCLGVAAVPALLAARPLPTLPEKKGESLAWDE